MARVSTRHRFDPPHYFACFALIRSCEVLRCRRRLSQVVNRPRESRSPKKKKAAPRRRKRPQSLLSSDALALAHEHRHNGGNQRHRDDDGDPYIDVQMEPEIPPL